MGEHEKRYSFVLTYYKAQLPTGELTESTRVVVAADTLEEAQTLAEQVLGDQRKHRACFINCIVEFCAHLQQ